MNIPEIVSLVFSLLAICFIAGYCLKAAAEKFLLSGSASPSPAPEDEGPERPEVVKFVEELAGYMTPFLPSFQHGEEGTHGCCKNRIKEKGSMACCCYCVPHDNCDFYPVGRIVVIKDLVFYSGDDPLSVPKFLILKQRKKYLIVRGIEGTSYLVKKDIVKVL